MKTNGVASATKQKNGSLSSSRKDGVQNQKISKEAMMKRETKPKVTFTHQQQVAREILVRVFREEVYSKEFLDRHLESTTPLVVPLLNRHEQQLLDYLIDRLLRQAQTCQDDKRMFHLPSSEEKLKRLFYDLVGGWKDTD